MLLYTKNEVLDMNSNHEKIRELTKELNIPSIYICGYIFDKKGYDANITNSEVVELSKLAKMMNDHIKEGVQKVCLLDGMDQENFISVYDMVIDSKSLCQYFMSSSVEKIVDNFKTVKGNSNKSMIHNFFSKIDPILNNAKTSKYSPWG